MDFLRQIIGQAVAMGREAFAPRGGQRPPKTTLSRSLRTPPMRVHAWAKHLRLYGCRTVKIKEPSKYMHGFRRMAAPL